MSARIGLLAVLLALSGCNLLGLHRSELNYRGIELRAALASGAAHQACGTGHRYPLPASPRCGSRASSTT